MPPDTRMPAVDHTVVDSPRWGAILAIAFSVATILTAEFLPVSLLTPMAHDLGVSEGMAGQAVAVTALAAIFSSLFVTTVTRGIDRRLVVMSFSALLIVSSLIVALADAYATMLLGRVLLGFALGGFWAMAAALAMRLVPSADVSKALSIVFGGVSVAMVIAAPLGSFLGALVGWRGVFLVAAGLGIACFLWQAMSIPRLPSRGRGNVGAVFAVLKRQGVPVAMLAIFAVFAGQFAFFTYLRPFLEQVSGFDIAGLSTVLLAFGIANFVGTSLSSFALRRDLKATLAITPLALALCAAAMVAIGDRQAIVTSIIALWGFLFGLIPVGWSTWVTRHLGDVSESAGGLQVAVIQTANTIGAALGGAVFDLSGPTGPVVTGGLLLAITAVLVARGVRSGSETKHHTQPLTAQAGPSHGCDNQEARS